MYIEENIEIGTTTKAKVFGELQSYHELLCQIYMLNLCDQLGKAIRNGNGSFAVLIVSIISKLIVVKAKGVENLASRAKTNVEAVLQASAKNLNEEKKNECYMELQRIPTANYPNLREAFAELWPTFEDVSIIAIN
eukprot:TRINITY_DN1443_c0_g2_i3.p1 TRINITY_DN1443_c0_g2~~TRINITY_DN1443_c0_g2_i3.p1  ORF type:complete len:136 (-),score=12.28 TRINITY_DN1443_c0_g2_i3:277-684(-)